MHEDLLVIYKQPDEQQFRAIYFDNEGHIIHYSLSFPTGQPGVIFESQASQTSPLAKLVYEITDKDTLVTEFFVSAPGGELLSHVKGMVRRDT